MPDARKKNQLEGFAFPENETQPVLTPSVPVGVFGGLAAPIADKPEGTEYSSYGKEEQTLMAQKPDTSAPYQAAIDRLRPLLRAYAPDTPEDIEKRRRVDRSRNIIAAVGDGIQALANLIYTTKGSPDAYKPQASLSARNAERYRRLSAERRQRAAQYAATLQRLGALESGAQQAKQQEWQWQLSRLDAKRARQAATQAAQAKQAQWAATYAQKAAAQQEQERHNRAMEEASRTRGTAAMIRANKPAANTRSGGGAKVVGQLFNPNTGQVDSYTDKNLFAQDAYKYAKDNNIPVNYTQQKVQTSKNASGRVLGVKTEDNIAPFSLPSLATKVNQANRKAYQSNNAKTTAQKYKRGTTAKRPPLN